jgi:hypothetical protein
MAQQLSYLKLKPFNGVFLDLKKAFDLMDRDRCIMIMEGYTGGRRMIWLIRTYWRDAIMVCHASGNYGTPFKAWRDPGRPTFCQVVQHLGQCCCM